MADNRDVDDPSPDDQARTYRTREFAALSGVTIRALHHYDRLGLLTPRRTTAGHRVYSIGDLESVRQIVALKLIGLPLKDIAVLRDANGPALAVALRTRRVSLEVQQRLLNRLIAAIRDVEDALNSCGSADPQLLRRIVEVIDVPHEDDKRGGDEADAEWRRVAIETSKHRRSLSPDVLSELGRQWESLLADIQAVLDQDPSAPVVQQLAARWVALIEAMNGTAVPLPTLIRCGQSTLRQFEKKSPEISSSPWARGMNLMVRAVTHASS